VHATLLACLLIVPLLGWTYTNARGHTLLLLGIRLPSLIFKDQYFSRVAIEGHEFLAYALLILIGAHVAAALWHHVVLRDATLKRMWRG
jgi:cytochrome b561